MQQTPTLAAPIPGGGAAPSPGPIAALVRWLERRRRATRARRLTVALDDRTLRDLGIGRAELSSYHAELDGLVEATRLRVIAQRLAGL
jgi:uncharacterized protein YjiS (DUF1127 family)